MIIHLALTIIVYSIGEFRLKIFENLVNVWISRGIIEDFIACYLVFSLSMFVFVCYFNN